jgi:uncharacterized membrane protein
MLSSAPSASFHPISEGQPKESDMSTLNLKRTIVLGVVAAIAASVATPSFAATRSGPATKGDYINAPFDGRCYTDEGYGRRSPCDGGVG